jgi:hypothetical protein
MKLLVTNDDGIDSVFFHALVQGLKAAGLELRPVDPARQLVQRLAGIEHRRQIGQQKLHLLGGIRIGLHRRSLPEIRPSWPVFLQTNQVYIASIVIIDHAMLCF